jgi:type II secretory pathway component GspD/PulD (secretin)
MNQMNRTNRIKRILAGLAWLAVALVLAWLPTAGALAADNPLDARVNIALRDATPDDTFRSFAKLLNAEAEVAPSVKGKVTVELRNVRVRTLLDAVCESIACRWELQPGTPPKLQVLPAPAGKATPAAPTAVDEPIDLRVTNADGRDVLKTFGELLSAQAEVDPGISGTVTLDLVNAPCGQALDKVCQVLGCDWLLLEGPPRLLRVTTKAKK